jgi:hypothetical protein
VTGKSEKIDLDRMKLMNGKIDNEFPDPEDYCPGCKYAECRCGTFEKINTNVCTKCGTIHNQIEDCFVRDHIRDNHGPSLHEGIKSGVRYCDIHPKKFIKIIENTQGDMILNFGDSETFYKGGIELSLSGSQSPKTREGLRNLLNAIMEEEKQHE